MSTSPTIQHPVATANRVALAQRIVAVLDANLGLFAAGEPTSHAVAQFGPVLWADINRQVADVDGTVGRARPISDLTIATVVGLLAAREV